MNGEKTKRRLSKKDLPLSLLLFSASFALFLFFWLQINNTYAKGIATVASHITAIYQDVVFEGITEEKEKGRFKVLFYVYRGEKSGKVGVQLAETDKFTFNAPLTFAVMAGMFFLIDKRKRAYLEGTLILVLIHVFYIFLLEVMALSGILAEQGLETVGGWNQELSKFLWFFADDIVNRSAPFLIAIYLILRYPDFSYENTFFSRKDTRDTKKK